MPKAFFCLFIFLCFSTKNVLAQKIVIPQIVEKKKNTKIFAKADTSKLYNPRIATIRSAIIPSWGQYTNKKYWKMPIVYAALGTTAYIFFRNVKQFNGANRAYKLASDGDTSNDHLMGAEYFPARFYPDKLKTFRNQVRQNVDYSVLFFIAFWGLNVVDAAVDANLKTFDVNDDLSLNFKIGYSRMANTAGLSLVLKIGKNKSKMLALR